MKYLSRMKHPNSISISRAGRFGNNIYQLHNAVAYALFVYNISKIYAGELTRGIGLLNPDFKSAMVCGIEVVYESMKNNPLVRRCKFFNDHDFPDNPECRWSVGSRFIFKDIAENVLNLKIKQTTDRVHVHLRSGDIFTRSKPKMNYTQPPLSFYQKALLDLEAKKVTIVFQNYENPVISELIKWCRKIGVDVRIVSGEQKDDINELLTAQHIICGRGTFAPIIACLSGKVKTISCFREVNCGRILDKFETEQRVYEDADGLYIPDKGWAISAMKGEEHARQIRQLIDYPIDQIQRRDSV